MRLSDPGSKLTVSYQGWFTRDGDGARPSTAGNRPATAVGRAGRDGGPARDSEQFEAVRGERDDGGLEVETAGDGVAGAGHHGRAPRVDHPVGHL